MHLAIAVNGLYLPNYNFHLIYSKHLEHNRSKGVEVFSFSPLSLNLM